VFTPAAYVPDGAISGVGLQVGAFSGPQDICVAPNGDLYIADTGNNRIIVVDDRGEKVLKIIDTFDNQGAEDTFNAPTGVCVSENGQLYIADRENRRIVVLELDGSLVKIVENPQADVLGENYVFKPLKVSVDYADRIYCIAQNMFRASWSLKPTENSPASSAPSTSASPCGRSSGRRSPPRRSVKTRPFTSPPSLPASISMRAASSMPPTSMRPASRASAA